MKDLAVLIQQSTDLLAKMQAGVDLSYKWSHSLKPEITRITISSLDNYLTWNVFSWVKQGMEKFVFLKADSFLRSFSYAEFEQSVSHIKANIGRVTDSQLEVEIVNYYLNALLEIKNGLLGKVVN